MTSPNLEPSPWYARKPAQILIASAVVAALVAVPVIITILPENYPTIINAFILDDGSGSLRRKTRCPDWQRIGRWLLKQTEGRIDLTLFTTGSNPHSLPMRVGTITRQPRQLKMLEASNHDHTNRAFLAQLDSVCKSLPTKAGNASPLVAGLDSLSSAPAPSTDGHAPVRHILLVRSDLLEESIRSVRRRLWSFRPNRNRGLRDRRRGRKTGQKRSPESSSSVPQPAPLILNNQNREVMICGLAERIPKPSRRKHPLPPTSHVASVIKALFLHPNKVAITDYCFPALVAEPHTKN